MEAAALSLQSAYDKAEATLDLSHQRLESELARSCTDQRLNPARLLRRIAALQQELPQLKAAAASNAAAERDIMDGLEATLTANHQATLELATRAAADVSSEAAEWDAARGRLPEGGHIEDSEDAACATGAAAASSPPPPDAHDELEPVMAAASRTAPAEMQISEAQWLRLDGKQRAGHALAAMNEFWALLQGLFLRRQVREVSAAQLLALQHGQRRKDMPACRSSYLPTFSSWQLAQGCLLGPVRRALAARGRIERRRRRSGVLPTLQAWPISLRDRCALTAFERPAGARRADAPRQQGQAAPARGARPAAAEQQLGVFGRDGGLLSVRNGTVADRRDDALVRGPWRFSVGCVMRLFAHLWLEGAGARAIAVRTRVVIFPACGHCQRTEDRERTRGWNGGHRLQVLPGYPKSRFYGQLDGTRDY